MQNARFTFPPGGRGAAPGLGHTLERNISALVEHRRRQTRAKTAEERVAGAITRFAGSMPFAYLHAAIYGSWIVANLGWVPGVPAWDPSMVVLAMIASVEAIFLSTFILISQNRQAAAEDRRAELNLQISLLAEHEVTKLVALVSDIARKLDVPTDESELSELKENVAPEAVLERLEQVSADERA